MARCVHCGREIAADEVRVIVRDGALCIACVRPVSRSLQGEPTRGPGRRLVAVMLVVGLATVLCLIVWMALQLRNSASRVVGRIDPGRSAAGPDATEEWPPNTPVEPTRTRSLIEQGG